VLTDAELDHVGGLLLLREGPPFRVVCTALVRRWLNCYLPIEPVLARFANPSWIELPPDEPFHLPLPDGAPSGLQVYAFEVDRHIPRFVSEDTTAAAGSVIGLTIQDTRTGGKLIYAPCVGSLGPGLVAAAREANGVLIDGTFWSDDEPARFGIGRRTAREMGHLPVGGPRGSLHWLAGLPTPDCVYVHINNTNPMLNERGLEARLVRECGVRVGADGDMFAL
jgi:pyrroloquinoline quinone biosynthesis protein B